MVNKDLQFFVFNETCIGASHLKAEKPCQDFSDSYLEQNAIIAVADGHGSSEHLKSDRGSRFAVEAAIKCVKELISTKNEKLTDKDLHILEKSIIAKWHEKIANDLSNDPNSYGTTLIAAGMTKNYWFAVQIGDGKCIVINSDDTITQPVPWDDRCFLNKTTSICDENAAELFRHYYSETLPKAIFIGTDGIDDCYPINDNEEYLAMLYKKIYDNFISEGMEKGQVQLREMLPILTQKGSGDDVSVAGIVMK